MPLIASPTAKVAPTMLVARISWGSRREEARGALSQPQEAVGAAEVGDFPPSCETPQSSTEASAAVPSASETSSEPGRANWSGNVGKLATPVGGSVGKH